MNLFTHMLLTWTSEWPTVVNILTNLQREYFWWNGAVFETFNNPHYMHRELALLKAEPVKNWNSFETFSFVTLRGSSYKINQDLGREKSGRHFLKPFSRWPTPKIKNKHNFGIINPMKLILVPKSMFLSMIYSHVHLKMHPEFTWP